MYGTTSWRGGYNFASDSLNEVFKGGGSFLGFAVKGGTVHWMKDNFVRFFFFKIKLRDVCYDKLKGFK